ncbi:MAG: hypothetical protein AYK19_01165 [Theionarchaea archaeon DG-70-1]|nr:MAG: hypothetical protein AYK19_01165 [Theionarchaea archaeon DG-70-1]
MNRKKVSIAVVSMAVAFLAVTCVTASRQTSSTPLYTFRMEQASNRMSFLPTTVNEFTYNTRDGYTLNYELGTDSDVGFCIPQSWNPFCTEWGTWECTCFFPACFPSRHLDCCTWWGDYTCWYFARP